MAAFVAIFIATNIQPNSFLTKLSGQYAVDGLVASNMNTLNARNHDFIWYMRSTIDYSIDVKWGDVDATIVHFYNAVRLRHLWGTATETHSFDTSLITSGIPHNIIGSSLNKHLMWVREGWLKFDLDPLMTKRHVKLCSKSDPSSYVQLGLIRYQVGRGISLGAAYDSSGFLGFKSDFSIDQYAPAMLLNFNVVPDLYSCSFYAATLKNKQSSFEDTLDELENQAVRNKSALSSRQLSYVLAWDHKLHHPFCNNIDIEPYVVHLSAPDQQIEFLNDTHISLTTVGVAAEALYARWSWGFEGALNFGELFLKEWDRNGLSSVRGDDGKLVTRYTMVYDQDPKAKNATLAQATAVNDGYVYSYSHSGNMNGKQIGPNLYNAYNRFRVAQKKSFDGYFLLADATYNIMPTVLECAVGAGYASGDFYQKNDTNSMSAHHCMNQKFSGFIPLQSEYAGKRIRHVVAFNQGLPRCDTRDSADVRETNLINDVQATTISDLTNIAFVGTRAIWRPVSLKCYGLELSGNIVGYWTPESVRIDNNLNKDRFARDFLGCEISTEFEWFVWKKLKFAGYAGVFLPGSFYRDNCGTMINELKLTSGTDVGFIGNVAVTYDF